MILLIHILIAMASIAFATYLFFAPSRAKLAMTYGLVASTVASGVYLIVSTPVHMTQTCVTGLVYLGAVAVVIGLAYRKLLAIEAKTRQHS